MPRPNARFALEIDNTQETNAAMRTPVSCFTQAIHAALSAHALSHLQARMRPLSEDSQARKLGAHVHEKCRAGSEAPRKAKRASWSKNSGNG